MSDIEKQWQECVDKFGENAYQMVDFESPDIMDDCIFCNQSVEIALQENYDLIFKESAELPFDMAAAKAGDDVLILIDTKLMPFDFLQWLIHGTVDHENINFNYPCDLRMRYPRRVGVDYSQFEVGDYVKVSSCGCNPEWGVSDDN